MFAGAVATVRASIDLAQQLPSQMADKDAAADLARIFAEDGMVRLRSSFQRFAEATYAAQPACATAPARRNAFQNLDDSDRLWSGAVGKTYADMLSADEHRDLVRLVQQRHVLVTRTDSSTPITWRNRATRSAGSVSDWWSDRRRSGE